MKIPSALLVLALTITACSSGTAPGGSIPPTATGSPAASQPTASDPPTASNPPASSDPTDPAGSAGTPLPDASPSPSPPDTDSDGDGRELVLRVDMGGGLAGPDQNALSIPQVSIYADGRVISQGVQILIYPGPALPPLMLSRLSPVGLDRVLGAASDAGLTNGDRHFPMRGIPDAHSTTFTVTVGGQTHVVTADALGLEAGHEDQFDAPEFQARQAMLEFQSALQDLRSWLGTDLLADGLPYEFEELRIIARPGLPPVEPDLVQPDLEWPLPSDLASFGEPYPMGEDARCGTVSGEALSTLLPLAMGANELTLWESGGDRYELLLRPLMPDEDGCPDT